ncbi:hypothetical protein [Solemya velum gill symbiont]|uniref:Uncharacterized protein n=1 Tax=Solemya velum gill symbiont TaxID=2340 RepID=A0A0B0HBJ6_SOVGS|nr:hypothetical protein [Solemya velum gill symbiont]KHF25249.1 hypothetical protein JV46_10410 [Solemya velum gill symbiont]
MNYQDYLSDALELLSAWNLPDDEFTDAVNDQAKLMAGYDFDETWGMHVDNPYSSHY